MSDYITSLPALLSIDKDEHGQYWISVEVDMSELTALDVETAEGKPMTDKDRTVAEAFLSYVGSQLEIASVSRWTPNTTRTSSV